MYTSTLGIAIAQINPVLCDLQGNADKIIHYCRQAEQQQARIVLFPECALSGYPLDDIASHPGLYEGVEQQLRRIAESCPEPYIMVGHPHLQDDGCYNAVSVLHHGKTLHCYRKQCLPNIGMFDEKRQFQEGSDACLFTVDSVTVAPAICEDIWSVGNMPSPKVRLMKNLGAMLLLSVHGSPYHPQRQQQRIENMQQLASAVHMPIVSSHLVGGQDDFVFDGASAAVNSDGTIALQAPQFVEGLYLLQAECSNGKVNLRSDCNHDLPEASASLYQALVMATRDFVHKSGHRKIVIGLSGGIDSALAICIAVDALGADAVTALLMPSQYTSDMSCEDAETLANALGVRHMKLPINAMHQDFMALLQQHWPHQGIDTAEENIQSRCRGMLLMAVANREGSLVLGTGNKSESAVGYSTLYGDTAAGFNPLGDIYKGEVYALADWRQQNIGGHIPERVLQREPSAELRPEQTDQDSLPPYDVLDAIVKMYVEQDQTAEQIAQAGFAAETVRDLLHRVEANEYKRRQSPPAPRVSHRSLQRERRYPICSKWQRTAERGSGN